MMIPDNKLQLVKLCAFYPGCTAEINDLHEKVQRKRVYLNLIWFCIDLFTNFKKYKAIYNHRINLSLPSYMLHILFSSISVCWLYFQYHTINLVLHFYPLVHSFPDTLLSEVVYHLQNYLSEDYQIYNILDVQPNHVLADQLSVVWIVLYFMPVMSIHVPFSLQ